MEEYAKPGEMKFTIAVLLLSTGIVVSDFVNSDGSLLIQTIWSAVYLIITGLYIRSTSTKNFIEDIISLKYLLFLIIWVFLSVLWSWDPSLTLRRSIAFTGTTILGVYLAKRFSWSQISTILTWVMLLVVLLSISWVLFFPRMGIGFNGWQGAFVTKNDFGRMMVLANLVWIIRAIDGRRIWLIAVIVGCILLALSQSTTAYIVMGTLILLILEGLLIKKLPYLLRISFTSFTAIIIFIVVSFFSTRVNALLNLVGKTQTLTGRTVIWSAVLNMIKQHWVLGYGYSAFWTGWNGPSGIIWSQMGWEVPNAHNGYLEVWLELGLVGLSLVLLSLLYALYRGAVVLNSLPRGEALFYLTYVIFMIIYNITEVDFVSRNTIFWILYVFVFARLSKKVIVNRTNPDLEIRGSDSFIA